MKRMEVEIKGTLKFLMEEGQDPKAAAAMSLLDTENKANYGTASRVHLDDTTSTVKEVK